MTSSCALFSFTSVFNRDGKKKLTESYDTATKSLVIILVKKFMRDEYVYADWITNMFSKVNIEEFFDQ